MSQLPGKIHHALAFFDWAKKILPEETYEEVNKKAAPASGGVAKKLNSLAKERLDKAFLESPQNARGLGHDSTLEVVRNKGKFSKDEAGYRDLAEFGFEACGGCAFYARDPNGSEVGTCLVVEGDIPWNGTSDLYISAQAEAIHSFEAMRQSENLNEALNKSSDPEELEKRKNKKKKPVYGSDDEIEKKIKRKDGKFVVTSEDGTKELGTYDTKEEAIERLRQIEGHKQKSAEVDFELTVDFAKADDERQIVYGVVLEPDEVDSQGDIVSADEIEKAAHAFMIKSRTIGKQHDVVADAEVVESYIVPDDIAIGEEEVRKGTWVMAVKVHDTELWKEVKDGNFNGFSIGGKGTRTIDEDEEAEESEE